MMIVMMIMVEKIEKSRRDRLRVVVGLVCRIYTRATAESSAVLLQLFSLIPFANIYIHISTIGIIPF
jgi:hypothetical protein